MSLEATTPLDPATQRQVAVDLFDHCWTLLALPVRTPDEDDELLHAAHASRHHWGAVGTVADRARGEVMCSRVYATLARPEPATYHAYRALALVESGGEGLQDWDRPAALGALARARLCAGDPDGAAAAAAGARAALGAVADPEDRAVVAKDLEALGL